MSFTDRHVCNPVLDYPLFLSQQKLRAGATEEGADFISSKDLCRLKQTVREWLEEKIQLITRAHPSTSLLSPSSVRGHETKDFSIYVGSGGNAYLLWRVSNFHERERNAERAAFHLQQANEAVNMSLRILPRRKKGGEGIAFFIGNAGNQFTNGSETPLFIVSCTLLLQNL